MCDRIGTESSHAVLRKQHDGTDGIALFEGVIIIVTWEGLLCVIAFASLIVEIIALMTSKKK